MQPAGRRLDTDHLRGGCSVVCGVPDDLDLCLDDKCVGNCEALQHLGQLHELLPPPVMLLLAEPVKRVCMQRAPLAATTGGWKAQPGLGRPLTIDLAMQLSHCPKYELAASTQACCDATAGTA